MNQCPSSKNKVSSFNNAPKLETILIRFCIISFFTCFFSVNVFSQSKCTLGDCTNGYGIRVDENGQVWEGIWKNGFVCGYGIVTVNENLILGYWNDDGTQNPNKIFNSETNPFNKFDEQGKPDGLWIMFFPTINNPEEEKYADNPYNLKYIGRYKNGVKDGKWLFYNDGQILNEENYKNGIKDGRFIMYWDDGYVNYRRLRVLQNFKDGELNGVYKEFTHYGNNVFLVCNYLNDKKDGEEIDYYDINTHYENQPEVVLPIKRKRAYKLGKVDGDELFYREDGILTGKNHWKMGTLEFSYKF